VRAYADFVRLCKHSLVYGSFLGLAADWVFWIFLSFRSGGFPGYLGFVPSRDDGTGRYTTPLYTPCLSSSDYLALLGAVVLGIICLLDIT